jgi:hypothetical protein
MANVFISHRIADSQHAEQLSLEIKSAGHRVWLDTWEINLGDSIIEKMNEGLAGATYVVLCCSSSGATSPWMGREWMSALARQLGGEEVRVIPVVLTGGDTPVLLRDIRHANLVKDWSVGVAELLRAIK